MISARVVATAHSPPGDPRCKAEEQPVLLAVLHREGWERGQQVGFPLVPVTIECCILVCLPGNRAKQPAAGLKC